MTRAALALPLLLAGCLGTDFAAAGIFFGFSCKAATTIHVPHATAARSTTITVVRTPAITRRQRPPLDMARAFTGWEISLQLRAAGTLTRSCTRAAAPARSRGTTRASAIRWRTTSGGSAEA